MTENKRFFIKESILKEGFVIRDKEQEYSFPVLESGMNFMFNKALNELNDENEQLKQFQDRVFSWIDMHLQRLPTLRDVEFESDNEFADPSLYSGAIQILETMKRELKGD